MSALNGLTGKSLDLILHSPGGSLEAADQIVQYLRSKFERIRAIVPLWQDYEPSAALRRS